MASTTGTSRGSDLTTGRNDSRLSTETKAAPKTTEFVLTVAAIVGVLLAALLIKGGDTDGTDEFIARQAWLYVSIMVGAYTIGRGLAKSGSRDPYFSDGTNASRGDR